MGITIRDIEKETGVSRSTVERILNNKRTVDDEKKRTVLDAVKRLNYNPLSNIPLLNKVKTSSIGVVSHITNLSYSPFYNKFVNAMKSISATSGYDCLLYSEQDILRKTTDEFHFGRQNFNCDGLVFFCPYQYEKYLTILRSWDIPCVLVRRKSDLPGVACINNNDEKSMKEMVDHLYSLGHQRIAYVGAHKASTQDEERDLGYRAGLKTNNLPVDSNLELEVSDMRGFRYDYSKLMEQENPPTALMCYDDHIAINAMRELQKQGVRIPDEAAVTGFNDDGTCELVNPALTTIRINTEKIAEMACKVLIDKLVNNDVAELNLVVKNELVVRESCGAK